MQDTNQVAARLAKAVHIVQKGEAAESKPCVLVTSVGGRSVGCQILQALLLHGEKYRIVATDADAFSFGLYQVQHRYVVPFAQDPHYLLSILRLVEMEGVNAILPGTEAEVQVLTRHGDDLESVNCRLIANPAKVVSLCSNKWRLYQWLKTNNIGAPRTVLAHEWEDLVAEVGFPIVGKPTEATGGSRSVAILKDDKEVWQYLEETGGSGVIFQEYIGASENEYTVGVLVSETGDVIDSIAIHRKLVGLSLGIERVISGFSYALSTGYSQGHVVKHPLIQQICEGLVVKLGARGPANIQCRLVGDEVKVFEVHPRFSGTTSIRAEVGFNEPDVLIRNYLYNEAFGRLNYQTDVVAIRAFSNAIVPFSVMSNVPRASTL